MEQGEADAALQRDRMIRAEHAITVGKHLLQERSRPGKRGGLAGLYLRQAELKPSQDGIWMIGAKHPDKVGRTPLELRHALGQPSRCQPGPGQSAAGGQRVRVIRAEYPRAFLHVYLVKRDRFQIAVDEAIGPADPGPVRDHRAAIQVWVGRGLAQLALELPGL